MGIELERTGGQSRERLSRALDEIGQQDPGQQSVAGGGQISEDHVAGLLASEDKAAIIERVQDVAVADADLNDLDPGLGECDMETEVAHHRDNDCSAKATGLGEISGEEHQQGVTVDDRPGLVNRHKPVSVSVKSQTDAGP